MEAIKLNVILSEDGKIVLDNLPAQKGDLLEIIILVEKPLLISSKLLENDEDDPILQMVGLGQELWAGVDPDKYVQELREGWE